MGRTYVECLAKHNKRARLITISGGSRAPKLASEYGVDYSASYDELLTRSDLDAVVVTTPPGNHSEHVIEAAEHGKHAMVEKPMAPSHQDCERMISACKNEGVYLE